ncbi:outer membrane protein [Bradyrhizobium arachidis]|nr:outer membrane beta-barrel protein [Bradyrhizobium arachidis]SFU99941.1 outer membrane immunogenic protein [Bradyrhizobium arachidis]
MKTAMAFAAGMSLLFAATGAACAADMAVKAPPMPPPVAVYSWTGCYVGVEGGWSWGRDRAISNGTNNGLDNGTAGALKTSGDVNGGLLGGTIGCNYQRDRWVFGIEGDGSWSGKTGSSNLVSPPFVPTFREDVSQSWIATIRGRVGFTVTPTVLLYGTAGGAFADLRIHEFDPTAAAGSPAGIGATETQTFAGWTAGAGVEWAFAPSWSAKVEYLYMDLGSKGFFQATATGCCTFQSTHLTDNIVRAGINYRFNWGSPVVAKY